jgi:DNA-binding SARP family transcriptional activator/tetratricopeptide (TPR) repeat protein
VLELRLLGPLEAAAAGRELDVGGPRQQVVLAMLALDANRVTPVEQLIDAVWSTSPPSTARAQVQICISGLRRLFGDVDVPWRIKTRSPGYLLEVPSTEIDSEQFTRLVATSHTHTAAGRVTEAAVTLRSALALWRGPALAGLDSELVRRGAARLDEARLKALTERFRLDLALGRHEEIIGELTAQTEAHPLRERLCELLMLALYRSGRQAEALEVCRRMRSRLVGDLGIEPGQGLQYLESAILNSDPALDVASAPVVVTGTEEQDRVEERRRTDERPPAPPRRMPAAIGDFTGRDCQLTQIVDILSQPPGVDEDPHGMRIVSISGKSGVGKSALAIRAAHELLDRFPDGHLYVDLEEQSDDNGPGRVLARFLRALGVSGQAIPEEAEERADLYRGRVATKRLLVVLDGVADEEQALPLLPGSPSCAVIVTSRARLTTLPGAHDVDVDVFDSDDSVELLAKIVGAERVRAERDATAELVSICGGLPLALRIAGARLASRPHWRIEGLVCRLRDAASRLDEFTHRGLELRSNIGVTYRGLAPEAQRLFRLLALVRAPDFAGWTAAALLDSDPFDADEVLESLVEARLLDAVDYPGMHQRYRFHGLIREYARERLAEGETPVERQAAEARLLGAWLAFAELAHRNEYGGDHTILHSDAPRWQPAGGPFGTDYPMEWWEAERRALVRAVHHAAEAGLDDLCWDLALTSVTLFEVKGYFEDWHETATVAGEITERTGNRVGHAATLYSLGSLYLVQKRFDEAARYFSSALAMFETEEHTHGRALVLRHAAAIDRHHGRSAAMLWKYDQALAMMREVNDPVGEAHILRNLARYWIAEGELEGAHELLDTALACCQRVGYLRGEVQVVTRFAELYLNSDQIEPAHQSLNRVLSIVRDIGDRIGEAHALYWLGVVRHRTGRLDNADTTLRHALSIAREVEERLIEGQALYALGEIELARGNGAAAACHLDEARQLFTEIGSNLWHAKTLVLLSDVHEGRGDPGQVNVDVELAVRLLDPLEDAEAVRLRDQLKTAVAAPPAVESRAARLGERGVSRVATGKSTVPRPRGLSRNQSHGESSPVTEALPGRSHGESAT